MQLTTIRFLLASLGFAAAFLAPLNADFSTSQAEAGVLSIRVARDQEPAKPAPDGGDAGGDSSSGEEGSDEESD